MNAPLAKRPRPGSLWRTVMAVLWSFLGIRKAADYQQDTEQLNPFHIIVVGILMALFFVLGLIALVNWAVVQPTGL
jgi:amino acid transporter